MVTISDDELEEGKAPTPAPVTAAKKKKEVAKGKKAAAGVKGKKVMPARRPTGTRSSRRVAEGDDDAE